MLVPYATDAPVYHRPWGTVGLIVLNAVLFFAVGGKIDGWILEYVQRFPGKSAGMKLLLARIYLEVEKRPRKALQILETVPAPLPEALEPARRALIRKAKGAAEADPLESDLGD